MTNDEINEIVNEADNLDSSREKYIKILDSRRTAAISATNLTRGLKSSAIRIKLLNAEIENIEKKANRSASEDLALQDVYNKLFTERTKYDILLSQIKIDPKTADFMVYVKSKRVNIVDNNDSNSAAPVVSPTSFPSVNTSSSNADLNTSSDADLNTNSSAKKGSK